MTDKPDWMKVCSGINCDSCKSRKNKGKGDCLDFNIDKYPLITKYMGWEIHTSLDGNDMVAAMNKMRFTISNEFDNEWQEFFYNSFNGGVVADTCFDLCSNPARFFELMSSWLKEKENENT